MKEDEDFFKEICNLRKKDIRNSYKFLGEGISRKVYALNDDYVIKVAKGNEGIYQNSVENYVFNNAEEKFRKYLCPILFFEPKRLIMKRANPLSKKIKRKHLNLAYLRSEPEACVELKELTKHFLLFYDDIKATSSWGEIDGVNYLIDYGCTSIIGDYFYDFLFSLNFKSSTDFMNNKNINSNRK